MEDDDNVRTSRGDRFERKGLRRLDASDASLSSTPWPFRPKFCVVSTGH